MGNVFYWVLNMSILASLCGCLILLIRTVKKLPRRFFVFFWAIPLFRFLVPVAPATRYNLVRLITLIHGKSVIVPQTEFFGNLSITNSILGAESYFPLVYKTDFLKKLFDAFGTVWLVVALGLIFTFFLIYHITSRELRSATLLRDNIYVSDKINSPALYGIIKPKIVVPPHFIDDGLDYIILHEKAHLKRGDNLFRIIAFLTAAIHWFNPLAWLFLRLFYADLELACDETVISSMTPQEKKKYAHTLVSSVEKANIFASTFGGAKIRLRIENIFSYKKLSLISIAAFVLFLLGICYFLTTNSL